MIVSILALLLMGLLVGVVAKMLVPGRDPGGVVVTAIIGVAGAVLGGFLASEVLNQSGTLGFNLYTFVVGLVGAVILLLVYHAVNGGFRGRGYRSRYASRPRRAIADHGLSFNLVWNTVGDCAPPRRSQPAWRRCCRRPRCSGWRIWCRPTCRFRRWAWRSGWSS